MSLILGMVYMAVIGAAVVSMTVLLLKGKRESHNHMYMVCQGTVILWCCSQILILLSSTETELKAAYLLGNAGICFVGTFWYYFAVLYVGKSLQAIKKYLPFGLSCFHFLMVLTNEKHHLYYTSFSQESVEHGVFFYTNVITTYILVGFGAILLYRNLASQKESRTAKGLIIASVLVPVLLNVVYLTGFIRASFDITPLGFGISGIFVLLATMKYRFLEVNITAFDVILSGLSDGVGIFGKNGVCTYSNAAFYTLLGLSPAEEPMKMSVVERQLARLQSQDEEWLYVDEDGRYLQLQTYQSEKEEMIEVPMAQLSGDRVTVFMLKDVSKYYELLHQTRELAITNERLALERERNRIAQQVHDTAGHTLTMIQSYMKLASLSSENQEEDKVKEYLEQARALSSEGIKELRQSINQLRKQAASELVTQGILQLADQVKEIPVEVTVQGTDSESYSHVSRVLYDCVRESITNALKYAQASKIEIILRFQKEAVELIIGDDGQGCEVLTENNGIRGIRDRVEEAKGTVKFISAKGEGFLTRIKIPV